MNILEVKNLCTSFFTPSGEVKAVDDISFNLSKGTVLGIVGMSVALWVPDLGEKAAAVLPLARIMLPYVFFCVVFVSQIDFARKHKRRRPRHIYRILRPAHDEVAAS